MKPFMKRGKTVAAAAKAICEALSPANMRVTPEECLWHDAVKTEHQQPVLMFHRARNFLVRQLTKFSSACC